MAGIKKGKFEASTLIEVLIAMVIILVIFSIAIALFNNVLASGVSIKKIEVQQHLNGLSRVVADHGYVAQDEIMLDSISYIFSDKPAAIDGLNCLEIKASWNGQVVGHIERLYQVKGKHEEN